MAMVRLLDNLCNSLLDPNKRDMKLNMKEYSFNGANFTQRCTLLNGFFIPSHQNK